MTIVDPFLVARSGDIAIIVSRSDRDNPLAPAQLWSPVTGYSDVRALAVHLKFMYYVTEVTPPKPWVEPVK